MIADLGWYLLGMSIGWVLCYARLRAKAANNDLIQIGNLLFKKINLGGDTYQGFTPTLESDAELKKFVEAIRTSGNYRP